MKQALLFLLAAGTLAACNSNDQSMARSDAKPADTTAATATTASGPQMDYAYTINHPDEWERGSKENTKMALASLKKWENGDVAGATKDFADTVALRFDAWEKLLPRDSAKMVLQGQRNMTHNVHIDMEDFESVKSKDGKREYVSMWYKQKWQDHTGVWDSISVMDDVRIRNGKISEIDEKTRHFAKKKM